MTEATKTPDTYTSIPPTTDLNYWQIKTLDNKTRVFTPIDAEHHRALLIKAREGKPAKLYPYYSKRYNTQSNER